MAGSPVRTSTTPGITINKPRESLSSESDLTELSLSPSSSSFLSSVSSGRGDGPMRGADICIRRLVGMLDGSEVGDTV